jgi:hypothetical protein
MLLKKRTGNSVIKALDRSGEPYERTYGVGSSTNSPPQGQGNIKKTLEHYAAFAIKAEQFGYAHVVKQEEQLHGPN